MFLISMFNTPNLELSGSASLHKLTIREVVTFHKEVWYAYCYIELKTPKDFHKFDFLWFLNVRTAMLAPNLNMP